MGVWCCKLGQDMLCNWKRPMHNACLLTMGGSLLGPGKLTWEQWAGGHFSLGCGLDQSGHAAAAAEDARRPDHVGSTS